MEGARKPSASRVVMMHDSKGRDLPPHHQSCTNFSKGGPSSRLAYHFLLPLFSLYFSCRDAVPSLVTDLFQQPVKVTL